MNPSQQTHRAVRVVRGDWIALSSPPNFPALLEPAFATSIHPSFRRWNCGATKGYWPKVSGIARWRMEIKDLPLRLAARERHNLGFSAARRLAPFPDQIAMPKVIVLDKIAQEGLDLLAASPGIEYEVRTGLKGEDLCARPCRIRWRNLPQRREDYRRIARRQSSTEGHRARRRRHRQHR